MEHIFGLAGLMAELGNDPLSVDLEKSVFSSAGSHLSVDLALSPLDLFPKRMSS